MENLKEKEIDIIIPAYQSRNTIEKTLESIRIQTIVDKVAVTIVNDCGEGYSDFVDNYSKYFLIREIKTEENCGPGDARQLGLDKTSLPYICFMDSDDRFYDSESLEALYDGLMLKEQYYFCLGTFVKIEKVWIDKEKSTVIESDKPRDLVSVYAKIFRRKFLNELGIHFPPHIHVAEDMGFLLYWLMFYKSSTIYSIGRRVYYFDYVNNKAGTDPSYFHNPYSSEKNFIFWLKNYIDSALYVFKQVENRPEEYIQDNLLYISVLIILRLRSIYIDTIVYKIYTESLFEYFKEYYKKWFYKVESRTNDRLWQRCVNSERNVEMCVENYNAVHTIEEGKEFLNKLKG